ncbi:hypothetical protein DITRI_Ditri16bG0108100 [Diplodiscus trichospermus]
MVAAMVKILELRGMILLRQKDEEILKATNKTMELQNLLKKLKIENQAWQRVAKQNESMVLYFKQHARTTTRTSFSLLQQWTNDAKSCCEVNGGVKIEENKGFVGPVATDHGQEQNEERTRKMMLTLTMVCKYCNSKTTSVLFLPCRHLSSCKDCALFLTHALFVEQQRKLA